MLRETATAIGIKTESDRGAGTHKGICAAHHDRLRCLFYTGLHQKSSTDGEKTVKNRPSIGGADTARRKIANAFVGQVGPVGQV